MFALAVVILSPGPAAAAEDPRETAPAGLILTYHIAPRDRVAMREVMLREGVPTLERLRQAHRMAHFRLLWSRYPDAAGWDMMLVLEFAAPDGIAGWRQVEEASPSGLPPAALALVREVESVPIDDLRHSAVARPTERPVYLAVPYQYLVGLPDYVTYADGYVLPQVEGWMREGVLGGYDLVLARYPAGRAWNAMLLLAYRGDAGLGRRDAAVARVRAQLAADPRWKAWAETKQKIREERVPTIADLLAEG